MDQVSPFWSSAVDQSSVCLCTGEARTEAMVAAKEKATGADDNDFDSFVEPASLILSTVIKFMPASYPDRARLLEKAENMKLPGNPLVSLPISAATDKTACCYALFCMHLHSCMAAFLHPACGTASTITAAANVLQGLMQKARINMFLDLSCIQNLRLCELMHL